MATAWNSNFYTVRPPVRKEDDPSGGDLGIFLMPPHQKKRMNHHHHQQQRKLDLLQNCDLPPPSKIFSPTDKIMMADSMNKSLFRDYPPPVKEEEELELLRAVRLSQTRAREAEMRRVEMEKEKERLASALEVEAMRIFGYRQILRILEVEVGVLKGQKEGRWTGVEIVEEEERGDDGGGSKSGFSWAVVVALCLGAVGVGFAVGCRYLL